MDYPFSILIIVGIFGEPIEKSLSGREPQDFRSYQLIQRGMKGGVGALKTRTLRLTPQNPDFPSRLGFSSVLQKRG